MAPSKVFIRDRASGELVDFGRGAIQSSSASASWRAFVRVEQHSRQRFEVEHNVVWDTIVVHRRRSILQQRIDGGPLQKMVIEPGDVHIYGSGVSVYARTAQNTEYVVIQLAPGVLSAAASELEIPVRLASFRVFRDSRIEQIATLFESELRSGCSSGRLYGASLAMALATCLVEHHSDERSRSAEYRGGLPGRSLSTALEYMRAHAATHISLQELADVVHMSVFHFCRLFKKSTGLTPHQYMLHLRMEDAKRLLLSSNLKIAEIGHQVGFADQSHFTAAFRKIIGITPHHWRKTA